MPTNWPPASAPSWPPPQISTTWFSASDIKSLAQYLLAVGYTQGAPTSAETDAYFKNARCDHGHTVVGRILMSPSGVRYPVAICTDATHRDVLVLWPPYYCGARSGENWTW